MPEIHSTVIYQRVFRERETAYRIQITDEGVILGQEFDFEMGESVGMKFTLDDFKLFLADAQVCLEDYQQTSLQMTKSFEQAYKNQEASRGIFQKIVKQFGDTFDWLADN